MKTIFRGLISHHLPIPAAPILKLRGAVAAVRRGFQDQRRHQHPMKRVICVPTVASATMIREAQIGFDVCHACNGIVEYATLAVLIHSSLALIVDNVLRNHFQLVLYVWTILCQVGHTFFLFFFVVRITPFH